MARKRTPLVSDRRDRTSSDFAKEAIDKIHGEEKKRPGPVSFFSKWSDDELTKLLVKIPKSVKKRLKITSVNQDKTEAQVVYEILNRYLDN